MEASNATMAFRVVDPPQVALAPKSPNHPAADVAVLIAALGGGSVGLF